MTAWGRGLNRVGLGILGKARKRDVAGAVALPSLLSLYIKFYRLRTLAYRGQSEWLMTGMSSGEFGFSQA